MELAELTPFPMAVADAYRDLLFHGPLFQGIVAIAGMDARGAERAAAGLANRDGACPARTARPWLLDPVLLDSALQMQVLWARLQWDVTLLPAEIGGYVLLAPVGDGRAGPSRAAASGPRASRRCATPTTGSTDPTDVCWRLLAGCRRGRLAGAQPARGSARVSAVSSARPAGAIAIIGMACMFPGAPDVDAYWRNILGKVDATSDPPPQAWDPEVYYDPDFEDHDRTYCKRGGYLGELAEFDPLAHGIPPVAVGGEPDQWLALQIAREALADAGATELPDEVRARTGVILGKGTYLNGGNAIAVQRGLVVGQTIDLIRQLCTPSTPRRSSSAAARQSCSSVLPPLGPETVPGPDPEHHRRADRQPARPDGSGLHGRRRLRLLAARRPARRAATCSPGDCDLALAGGAQVWMPVATLNLFCRLGALSRREQLRAFDKDADGTLLGRGDRRRRAQAAGGRRARRRPRLRRDPRRRRCPATDAG